MYVTTLEKSDSSAILRPSVQSYLGITKKLVAFHLTPHQPSSFASVYPKDGTGLLALTLLSNTHPATHNEVLYDGSSLRQGDSLVIQVNALTTMV